MVGAAGKTGRAVIGALEMRGLAVRPLVRRPGGLLGERVVDLLDADSLRVGLEGAATVYHLAPNMHPAELEMGHLMIEAARRAGVAKVVYHSVLHPQLEAVPHHWQKLQVEAALIESGIRWTILQPASYVQNFTRPADGVIRLAYRADAPFSFVDIADVGEAAAVALTSRAFESGTYELAGPEVLTAADVAQPLDARVEVVDAASWQRAAVEGGMARETAARFAAMFRHYDEHGLVGNPAALAMLLGRPPTKALAALLRDRPA